MDYARAVAALYQAPHGEFVAERKRLAGELKAAGDRDGAKALAKLGRPPISAWAVNQLYWHAREGFDRLMATATQLREGDLSASAAHREALGKLRQRAATILAEAGHTATEATLRRTAQTLSAIAALGSFAPDPPGALGDDRDPPGFDAAGLVASAPPPMLSIARPPEPEPEPESEPEDDDSDDDPDISSEEREAAAELLRAAATAKPRLTSVPASVRPPDEARRPRHLSSVPPSAPAPAEPDEDEREIAAVRQAAAEAAETAARARLEEKKRIARERDRLETALRTARGEVESRKRDAERLRGELARAEAVIGDASAIVADLERALAALD